MTLGEKQRRFVRLVGRLIGWAYENGYELTFGQTLRLPQEAAKNGLMGVGITNSLHLVGLAIDLNLFREGVYLTTTEDHRPLGAFWKSLAPDACWGGDFKKPDGNHYSLSWEGRK
jgi:hypothetical protein